MQENDLNRDDIIDAIIQSEMQNMQQQYLSKNDLVGAVFPNPNKVVTAQGIYNTCSSLSAKISELSNICNDLSGQQSLDVLSNYYLKNETSSATQLQDAFSRELTTLSIDFAKIYNSSPDEWLSAYVGGHISSTFIQAVNRINEIDIYCAFDDITTLTTNLDFEDISRLSVPTILICQHAGVPRSSIDVDTIEGIASALNRATEKLKIFGPNATMSKILRTYIIRNRVLEFQLAVLNNKVQRIQSQDSQDLALLKAEFNIMKEKLLSFANTLKIGVLREQPYVYDIEDKTNEIVTSLSAAADILNTEFNIIENTEDTEDIEIEDTENNEYTDVEDTNVEDAENNENES